jgi:hypothetical protein
VETWQKDFEANNEIFRMERMTCQLEARAFYNRGRSRPMRVSTRFSHMFSPRMGTNGNDIVLLAI